jgi:alkylhydroperoxidase family enzyme
LFVVFVVVSMAPSSQELEPPAKPGRFSPWAVAFHTTLGLKQGLTQADTDAIRSGRSPADSKLGALSTLARNLIEKRGRISDQDREAFFESGFGEDHLLEVIAVSAASTITNYTGNITNPPLEPAFQPHAWRQ